MLKPYWLTVLISVAVITLAGAIYITYTNNNNIVLASVWNQLTESYSGSKNITVYRSPSYSCGGL